MNRLVLVWLVLVDLDDHRFGFVRVAMAVIAIRTVNMGRRGRGRRCIRSGLRLSMVVLIVMVVATCTVSTPFGLKRVFNRIYDQVHGAQHVGQHMVRLNF